MLPIVKKKNLRKRRFISENRTRKSQNYTKTIFLKDFPQDCNEEKLKGLFEKYGKVDSVKINNNKAFLTFEEASAAVAANKEEKLLTIEGTKVYVNILFEKNRMARLITKKKDRKAQSPPKVGARTYVNEENVEVELPFQ
jgi:RNA recognition motif-containing protein